MPGWISSTVPDGDQLFELWQTDFEEVENNLMLSYHEQKMSTLDETEALSLDHELARCEMRKANFALMTKILKEDHGIICRNVCSDGNCGVETLLRLQRPADCKAVTEDLRPHFGSTRREVQACWESVVEIPKWRLAFQHLCRHQNSKKEADEKGPANPPPAEKKLEDVIVTPPRKDKADDCPFTPDPVEKRKAEQPAADGVVVIPGAKSEPPSKKKRTGKRGPVEETINLDKYMAQVLSENGVTYRRWLTVHKTDTALLQLVLI